MLGRRKTRRPSDTIDITERIRRRALDSVAPAKGGGRIPQPQSRGTERPGAGTGSTAPPSVADTQDLRAQAAAAVRRKILQQVLAVIGGRLESQGAVAGPREVLGRRISGLLGAALEDLGLRLSLSEQGELVERLLDELIGLGPVAADDGAGLSLRSRVGAARRPGLAGLRFGTGEGKGRQNS